jgi:hypothetical protein
MMKVKNIQERAAMMPKASYTQIIERIKSHEIALKRVETDFMHKTSLNPMTKGFA